MNFGFSGTVRYIEVLVRRGSTLRKGLNESTALFNGLLMISFIYSKVRNTVYNIIDSTTPGFYPQT